MSSDIQVLIPVKNDERFVGRAIESVLGQTYGNLSVIVSDNCSTDNTCAVVEGFMAYRRVSLIRRDRDIGSLENFNACLNLVTAPFHMLLCNDDMLVEPDALAHAALVRHPLAAAVYSDMAFLDDSGKRVAVRRFGRSGLVDPWSVAMKCFRTSRNWFGIPLLIRSSCVGSLRFSPELGYATDVDFSIKVSK